MFSCARSVAYRAAVCAVMCVFPYVVTPWQPAVQAQDEPRSVRLVYEFPAGERLTRQDVAPVLQARIGSLTNGRHKLRVLPDGKSLEITLPPLPPAELDRCKKLIAAPGMLAFHILALRGVHDDVIQLAEAQAGREVRDADQRIVAHWAQYDPEEVKLTTAHVTRRDDEAGQLALLIHTRDEPSGRDLQQVDIDRLASAGLALSAQLTPQGGAKMLRLTKANLPDPNTGAGRQLAIEFDGRILTAPTIRAEIGERFVITGDFTEDELRFLRDVLRAGQLPFAFVGPISEVAVEP